jgi:hypothetical protein
LKGENRGLYIQLSFFYHFKPFKHLHITITNVGRIDRRFGKLKRYYKGKIKKGQTFVVRPAKKGLRGYEVIDIYKYFSRRHKVIGKIVKSEKLAWWRVILYD